MHRSPRDLCSLILCLPLLTVACSGDDGGGEASATATDSTTGGSGSASAATVDPTGTSTGDPTGDPTGSSVGSETESTTGASTTDASTTQGVTSDSDSDSDSDSGSDTDSDSDSDSDTDSDTEGAEAFAVELLLSSELVLTSADEDTLLVACALRQGGVPYTGEFTATAAITPANEVTVTGENEFEFATFGIWNASCEVEVEGEVIASEREVAVLNDAIDPDLVILARGLGQAERALFHMARADGLPDQALIDAAADLEGSFAAFAPEHYSELEDVLIPVAFGYPTAAELEQVGISATADDPALAPALDAITQALGEIESTLAGIDPLDADEDDLLALEQATATLEAAVDGFSALELSAHGYLANRVKLADLAREAVAPTMAAVTEWIYLYVRDQSGLYGKAWEPSPWLQNPGESGILGPDLRPRFGFISLGLSFVNTSNLQVKLMNKMYGDAFKALDKMINQMILLEVIDYFYNPDAGAPEIIHPYASASFAYALEGYNTKFGGSGFHEDPAMNHFLIIGDGWQQTAENAMNACGIKPGDSNPKKYKKIKGCVQQVLDLAESAVAVGTAVDIPGLLDPIDVHIGPFPEACDNFVPVPIGIIPINLNTGSGPVLSLLCIDSN